MSKGEITIVNIFLGKGLGGIEKSFVDYVKYFKQLGYNSKAITTKGAKILDVLPRSAGIHTLSNFAEWDLIASYRLNSLLKKLGANVVIIHGRRAAKLCRYVNHIPKIGVAHNYSLKYLLSLDYIFAITSDLKQRLCEMGYKQDNIFDMPHMIEVPAKKQKQVLGKTIMLGAMGRFVPEKGFDILLKALRILKDKKYVFKLLLAGDGVEKERLEKIISDLKLTKEVKLLGWVDDISSFYKKINIFCLPSRKESFGLVLLEAFAYAKAVVSFKTKGPIQIGEANKDILFAECEDEKDFAYKLVKLLNEHKLIASLGNAAFKKVSALYNKKNNLKKIDSAISQITKRS